mgnify:CR=1 FL=1
MIELLEKIETILIDTTNQPIVALQTVDDEIDAAPLSHPLTSWTSDRILKSLRAKLPAAKGLREQEALNALCHEKYSRCRIYPQLVEDNCFIEAVVHLCNIPKAVESGSSVLPAVFNECANAILKAHDQTIAAISEENPAMQKTRDRAQQAKADVMMQLEKLAIDVFAKGLGDTAE